MKLRKNIWAILIFSFSIGLFIESCSKNSDEQEDVIYSDQTEESEDQEDLQSAETQQEENQNAEPQAYASSDSIDSGSDAYSASESLNSEADALASDSQFEDTDQSSNDYAAATGGAEEVWNDGVTSSQNDSNAMENPYADSTNSVDPYSNPAAGSNSYEKVEPEIPGNTYAGSTDTANTYNNDTYGSGSYQSDSNTSYGNSSITPGTDEKVYLVQPGDTLGRIARKIYGDPSKWSYLSSLNNITNPNKIYPGDKIVFGLDASSQEFATKYENVIKNQITVQSGDSLSKIAKRVLGDGKAWKLIWALNKSKISDPNRIKPNVVLYYITKSNVYEAFRQSELKSRFLAH